MSRDYTSLDSLVTPAAILALKRRYGLPLSLFDKIKRVSKGSIGIGILVAGIVLMFAYDGRNTAEGQQTNWLLGITIVFVIVAGIFAPFFDRKRWIRDVRLTRFAEANNMTYLRETAFQQYSGMMFNVGAKRHSTTLLQSNGAKKAFEIANFSYEIGEGDQRHTVERGYIMIQLERNLPHMVLDSRINNAELGGLVLKSNLPEGFKKDQKLSLEGDFDKYFTLYAPKGYERDALYVFTPDLMALFIDEVSTFDGEIVDNQLFIYGEQKFDLTNQAQLERIFQIIETVGTKAIRQTKHYADERVGDKTIDFVAAPGQRLHLAKSWILTGMILVLFIVCFVIPMVSDFLKR